MPPDLVSGSFAPHIPDDLRHLLIGLDRLHRSYDPTAARTRTHICAMHIKNMRPLTQRHWSPMYERSEGIQTRSTKTLTHPYLFVHLNAKGPLRHIPDDASSSVVPLMGHSLP